MIDILIMRAGHHVASLIAAVRSIAVDRRSNQDRTKLQKNARRDTFSRHFCLMDRGIGRPDNTIMSHQY
jgi:hypothetical protein